MRCEFPDGRESQQMMARLLASADQPEARRVRSRKRAGPHRARCRGADASHDVVIGQFRRRDVANNNAGEIARCGVEQRVNRLRVTLGLLHINGLTNANSKRHQSTHARAGG